MDRILRQAIRSYSGQFIRRKIRLEYIPTEYIVLTDEKWLLFVLEQILSNAIKYTQQSQGRISVRMEKETLIVEDNGIGIAPEDLPRIFEKGYTGYNGRYDKKASGIGLYLCRRICRQLGHEIRAESKLGEGTKVFLKLEHKKQEYE